jgi:hypothetical protein
MATDITRRTFRTDHKSEGDRHDPYAVDIYTIDTNLIRVTLRIGALGYERLTVKDMQRGWVLDEFEVYTTPWLKQEGENIGAEREISLHLEHWTGLTRKQLFRISERLEAARLAADPFGGCDPYYGGP